MSNTRNTIQKEIILNTLREQPCHPTASQLYEAVRERYPSISRSTVFRVLSAQADAGEILRLHLDGESDRFDGTTGRHSHICCQQCGRVADVAWMNPEVPEDTAGYEVTGISLHYSGLCPQCRETSCEDRQEASQ